MMYQGEPNFGTMYTTKLMIDLIDKSNNILYLLKKLRNNQHHKMVERMNRL